LRPSRVAETNEIYPTLNAQIRVASHNHAARVGAGKTDGYGLRHTANDMPFGAASISADADVRCERSGASLAGVLATRSAALDVGEVGRWTAQMSTTGGCESCPSVFVNRIRGVASEWVRIGAGTIGSWQR